jgi:cobalt-precorrin-5B (C1)-methyltransferase
MNVSLGAMRTGFTSGTCAAAAAKAAALALCEGVHARHVDVALPSGERVTLPIVEVVTEASRAEAAVRKDAGDDPDVTHGLLIRAAVAFAGGQEIELRAGDGVGTITLPGLAVPPGAPAINPAPRRQIQTAVREVTERGLIVTLSIPSGAEIALRTYNPRLGVRGGLSILGTEGRVRPFSDERLVAALVLTLDVAKANGITAPILVPGHLGRRAALESLGCPEMQVVETANAVGAMLDHCQALEMPHVLLFGHPGKLAKLVRGDFDTHSSRSASAVGTVVDIAQQLGLPVAQTAATTEAVFAEFAALERTQLGVAVARAIRHVVLQRFPRLSSAVWLTDLAGNRLGTDGDLTSWMR